MLTLTLFVLQLLDWSKAGGDDRLLTFYRLCDAVAQRLKGLFVLFAGNLVKPFTELLQRRESPGELAPSSPAAASSSSSSRCSNVCLWSSDESTWTLMLQYVLDCLHKIFLYDTQRFLSKERADALLSPLVDQVRLT